MPKVVDHDARRREIADALFAIVRRDGIGAVSVRSVAAEAGLSVGSMRHTAASQGELLAYAMQVLSDRVVERVARRATGPADVDGLTEVCCELLPLDAERMAEAAVWFELVALARTDPALHRLSLASHEGIGGFARSVTAALLPETAPERVDHEAARLHALLDGLALHGVLHPDRVDAGGVRELVRAHLRGLAG